MSFDSRVGIAGLFVGLVGIALMYLWPDKKWIGWLFLGVAGILLVGWAVLEVKQRRTPKPEDVTQDAERARVKVDDNSVTIYGLQEIAKGNPQDIRLIYKLTNNG